MIRIPIPAVGLLCAALITGGCSVSVSNPDETPTASSSDSPSIVRENKATLDFTQRPTRESFAIPTGRTFKAYQREGPMFEVTVKLPTGSFTTPAFLIEAATTYDGGGTDKVATHPPKYFNISAVYPSGHEALEAVLSQAGPLGLDSADVAELQDVLGQGGTVPQSRVLNGLIEDWLSVEVVLTDQDGTEVQVTYEVAVDVYHNDAVDQVLRDGVMRLSLTRQPTREELGFLATYNSATVQPEPGRAMSVMFDSPLGQVQVPADSVSSGSGDPDSPDADPQGVEPPGTTMIVSTGTNPEIRRSLEKVGSIFDISPESIDEAMSEQGTEVRSSTPVYDLRIVAGGDPERVDDLAATVKYFFTWK